MTAAASRLSTGDVGLERLPDTGSYRSDALALFVPDSAEGNRLRLQALTALLFVARADPEMAERVTRAGIGPWVEANRRLMRRAIERGEFPEADVDALAQVIPMMCLARALQHKPVTEAFSLGLLDGVVIPALRGGH
ncbi:TetR-like C-terminal domain-containing protein [Streptomyces sp. NPDC049916]|uniref:TetR-like C-terminal domain-containing protein n=1 Tax=Streptomyces sp. NPDC049916 TaxID=3155156 RepID=UPI003431AC0C